MTFQRIAHIAVATALAFSTGCKKDNGDADDSDVENVPVAPGGGGGGAEANGSLTIKGVVVPRDSGAAPAAAVAFDLTSFNVEISQVTLHQEGAAEPLEFVLGNRALLDLFNGNGEFTVSDVPPGVYQVVAVSVGDSAIGASYSRVGSSCNGESADLSDTIIEMTGEITVTAGGVTTMALALPPEFDVSGGGCKHEPRVPSLLLGPEEGFAADWNERAESGLKDLNVIGKWSTACLADEQGGYETMAYAFAKDGSVTYTYLSFSDASCTTKTFGVDADLSISLGEYSSSGSFADVDTTYGDILMTAYTQDQADGMSADTFCGEAAWQIGEQYACNDDLGIAVGKKAYGLIGIKKGVLYWDEEAADTAADRPTALSSTKFLYVGPLDQ